MLRVRKASTPVDLRVSRLVTEDIYLENFVVQTEIAVLSEKKLFKQVLKIFSHRFEGAVSVLLGHVLKTRTLPERQRSMVGQINDFSIAKGDCDIGDEPEHHRGGC